MKSHNTWMISLLILIALCVAGLLISHYIRPVITVENASDQPLHLYTTVVGEDEEPPLDMLSQWDDMITLEPGETRVLPLGFVKLIGGSRYEAAWRIGQAKTGQLFNQGFITSRSQGLCNAIIHTDGSGFRVQEGPSGYCYKKLVALWPR